MREKAMSRVAEVNFVGVNPDPLGRPVRYPSRAADNHCTMISQTAAQTPKAVAERPELYHGDTEVRPRPEPIASKIKLIAAMANAPAKIAAHDKAETRFRQLRFAP